MVVTCVLDHINCLLKALKKNLEASLLSHCNDWASLGRWATCWQYSINLSTKGKGQIYPLFLWRVSVKVVLGSSRKRKQKAAEMRERGSKTDKVVYYIFFVFHIIDLITLYWSFQSSSDALGCNLGIKWFLCMVALFSLYLLYIKSKLEHTWTKFQPTLLDVDKANQSNTFQH